MTLRPELALLDILRDDGAVYSGVHLEDIADTDDAVELAGRLVFEPTAAELEERPELLVSRRSDLEVRMWSLPRGRVVAVARHGELGDVFIRAVAS